MANLAPAFLNPTTLFTPQSAQLGLPQRAAQPPDAQRQQPVETLERNTTQSNALAAFESVRVRREVQLAAVSAELSRAIGDGQDGDSAAGQQLTFDFFAETERLEYARFAQRTTQAAEGEGTAERASLVEVSQRVAARVEFSLSISGAALEGLGNVAEDGSSNEDLLARVFDLAEELLGLSEELFNEFFEQFSGSVAEGEQFDPAALFDQFFADIQSQFSAALQGLFGQATGGSQGTPQAAAQAVQLEFSFTAEFEATASAAQVKQSDPIVLDLDGDGIELTSYRNGARFDIQGNGQQVRTAFVTGGDAFLALDRNGDGVINDGAELFGDQRGAANGFEALRALDSNRDGRIDRGDEQFDALRLFRDNGDGRTEREELLTLAEAGVDSIDLNYANVDLAAANGNRLAQIAAFTRTDGAQGLAGDALLNFVI